MTIRLTGAQRQTLRHGLLDAFPTRASLELLLDGLGKRLGDFDAASSLVELTADVILTAEAQGWTGELVVAAVQSNPYNPSLKAAAEQLGLKTGG